MSEKIKAYKGFDKDLKCRGFSFEIGKKYVHEGEVKACQSGFHSCEYPLDVFTYYPPSESRFALVEAEGEINKHGDDSKVASSHLTIKAELTLSRLINAAIEYTFNSAKKVKGSTTKAYGKAASATGGRGAASATGDYGAASATGDYGAASATGYQGAASATGDYGAASATGGRGAASATGGRGAASATGYQGAASATGGRGAASATGYQGAASATGDYGAASATGYQGAASATGGRGAASATGYQGAASATGGRGAASATGKNSVAMASGYQGKAKAAEGCAIFLVFRNADETIIHAKAAITGKDVKADTWYSLDENGEFIEVQP
jgi:hypothetical protein